MLKYTVGNLLNSDAEALVNTVNCEGYMGKGIAYQFKLAYPKNNIDYIKACKSGKLQIGKVHYFFENGKIIINFPTKNKWRAKSKMEYIISGLDSLILLIQELDIKSIAIPPLGSGNGGLIWSEVKKIIEQKLVILDDSVTVYIYEPSQNYICRPSLEPQLSTSALVLMDIKKNLNKFNKIRLQKTAYFTNLFSHKDYFHFNRDKFGPYANSISIISKKIKEFQIFHNVKNTDEAYTILYKKIVSNHTDHTLKEMSPYIIQATKFVNMIKTDHQLECLATIAYIIGEHQGLNIKQIIELFKAWSPDKAERFTSDEIENNVLLLYNEGIIKQSVLGFVLN